MPEEEKKTVDLDTSGPEVDVAIEETKEEAVIDTAPETTEQETGATEQETVVEEKNGYRNTRRSIRRLW